MSEKTVPLNKKIFLSLSIIVVSFTLDRLSKIYVIKSFIQDDFKDQFINEFLNFTLIWNKGIAFGLLQTETFFYHFISFFILSIIIFIIYLIIKSRIIFETVCFSLIAGGAIGNLFDRAYYNAVPDFIDLHYKDFHWFIFNVADIFISIGIIVLILIELVSCKFGKNEKIN